MSHKILLYRIIVSTVILFKTSIVFAQDSASNSFSLSGRVTGQKTGFVYITYFDQKSSYIHDSCKLINGKFAFSGNINSARLLSFYGNRESRSVDDPNWMEMFIEPGKINAKIQVDEFKKAKISGSKSQKEFELYNRRIDSFDKKWSITFVELEDAKAKMDSNKIAKIYNDQSPIYREERRILTRSYIREFTNSAVSAYLIFVDNDLSLDSLKYYYSLLQPANQQGFYGNYIVSSIRKQENLQIGRPAPDFVQTDLKGNQISLSSYRGNYILLEFWASWCIPCRKESPYLKKAYSKYHDKGFEIISFSMDGPEYKNAWLDAIKKDGLSWIQLCDFKVWDSEVIILYNYLGGKGIPANYLINPNGDIIAKDLRGDELEDILSQLIK
jgi:peroxiredoxin